MDTSTFGIIGIIALLIIGVIIFAVFWYIRIWLKTKTVQRIVANSK